MVCIDVGLIYSTSLFYILQLILFNQDVKNAQAIHDTFVGGHMTFDEFREFCGQCWAEPFGFCVIDLTSKAYNGMYRCGFDLFYIQKASI